MTSPTSSQDGLDVDPITPTAEETYGVWMTPVNYEDLVMRANAKKTRISWPECVFGIFFMFFALAAIGIAVGR